jgi:hypothetical protein
MLNTRGQRSRRSVILWLPPLLSLGAVLALVGRPFWEIAWENRTHQLPFDSAVWKSGKYDSDVMWPTRLRMADSVTRQGILRGKTQSEVVSLLGEDEDAHPNTMSYVLGPERGFIRIDAEMLKIYFGSDGRVSRWEIENL